MTVLEANYQHAETARKALEYLKELESSPSDTWTFVEEKDGVRLSSREGTGEYKSIPIVRGDITLKTDFTPRDISQVATAPGCRAIWDQNYGSSEVKTLVTRWEGVFWVKVKTPWPVSARDFAGIFLRDMSDDECYVAMASVEDSKVPPIKGNVRGTIIISGWKIKKVEGGVSITYITQIDLAGSIPAWVLKTAHQEVPLCAGEVAKYVENHGTPPMVVETTSVSVEKEGFDHGSRKYSVALDGKDGLCRWSVSKKMYPNGVSVRVTEGKTGDVQVATNGLYHEVTVPNIQGSTKLVFSKA